MSTDSDRIGSVRTASYVTAKSRLSTSSWEGWMPVPRSNDEPPTHPDLPDYLLNFGNLSLLASKHDDWPLTSSFMVEERNNPYT
jgi:hypothetical protein